MVSGKDDDFTLFRKTMDRAGVKQARYQADKYQRKTPLNEGKSKPGKRQRRVVTDTRTPLPDQTRGAAIDQTDQPGAVLFVRHGLNKSLIKQLKNGHFPLDESIDLHGMREVEAIAALHRFLAESRDYRWQWVQIIHGKGRNSEQSGGVLRPVSIQWLKQQSEVLAFCSAPVRFGGTGATNVLLDCGC